MAIQFQYDNPFTGETIQAYAWCSAIAFDLGNNIARISFSIHPTLQSAYENRPPIEVRNIDLLKNPTTQLSYDEFGEPVVITTIPSFPDVVASNQLVYGALAQAIDELAVSLDSIFSQASRIIPEE